MNLEKDELERYFPSYLTKAGKESILSGIRAFQNKENYGLFLSGISGSPKDTILQGDICRGFSYYDFSKEGLVENIAGIVISNSCDISTENKRNLPVNVVFCPLFSLKMYQKLLEDEGFDKNRVEGIISSIKNQNTTNILFLPESQFITQDAVVRLDMAYSISLNHLKAKSGDYKICSLNQFGFYLLLFKLSVHFCRLHEGIERFEATS